MTTTNFYHRDGQREYDRANTGDFDDFDQEELTDDDLDTIAAEIEAVNEEEGRRVAIEQTRKEPDMELTEGVKKSMESLFNRLINDERFDRKAFVNESEDNKTAVELVDGLLDVLSPLPENDNKCPSCGQSDQGQTGEYPCQNCGLPRLHDSKRV